jgi:hypothetical protein
VVATLSIDPVIHYGYNLGKPIKAEGWKVVILRLFLYSIEVFELPLEGLVEGCSAGGRGRVACVCGFIIGTISRFTPQQRQGEGR